MRSRVWRTLERKHGFRCDDPASWSPQAVWGLQSLKRHSVFEPIGGPRLTAALDALLGPGCWKRPKDWGQMLVSFPGGGPWTVPHHPWHTDFPYTGPTDRVWGALVFSFVSDVPPRNGGTAVLMGSPELVRRFVGRWPREKLQKMKTVRRALMSSDPWLAALCSAEPDPERVARFMEREHVVDGVPLRVVELTGRAGDVVVGHPWLLHCPVPNRGDQPRIMRVQRIVQQRQTEHAA